MTTCFYSIICKMIAPFTQTTVKTRLIRDDAGVRKASGIRRAQRVEEATTALSIAVTTTATPPVKRRATSASDAAKKATALSQLTL